jgi:hypothetical protein
MKGECKVSLFTAILAQYQTKRKRKGMSVECGYIRDAEYTCHDLRVWEGSFE